MKDSGIEWIGEIPEDWNIERLQWYLEEVKVLNNPMQTDRVLSLTNKAGVIPYEEKGAQGNVAKEDYTQYKLAYPNTIVANSMNILIGSVGICNYFGCVSPVYYVLKPTIKADINFINYIMQTIPFQKELRKYANGILEIRLRVSANGILKRKIAVPCLSSQQKIVAEIDKKCAAVDRLMENQRLQIEKLKEYKQSLITEAVTKGLDKTVPLKSSGVEWIGDICKWFELRRLKEVAQILDEYRKPITADLRNQEADVLYDYYGASGVIDKIDGYTIDDHVMLIGEDGANLRMRNLPLMYEVKGKAWINNHAHILKPNADMNFYYLFYCLESLDINPYITGSAQPKLSQENLKNILLPVPPISEQQQIAEYLDTKCAEIDELISIKQQKIEKLTEYKKSLIYEYVTGKKEVGEGA